MVKRKEDFPTPAPPPKPPPPEEGLFVPEGPPPFAPPPEEGEPPEGLFVPEGPPPFAPPPEEPPTEAPPVVIEPVVEPPIEAPPGVLPPEIPPAITPPKVVSVGQPFMGGTVSGFEDGVATVAVPGGTKWFVNIDGKWVQSTAGGSSWEIAGVRRGIDAYNNDVAQFQSDVAAYEKRIVDLSADGLTQGEFDELMAEFNRLEKRAGKLNDDLAELEVKMTDAQKEVGQYDNILEAIEAGVSDQKLFDAGYSVSDINNIKTYLDVLRVAEQYKYEELTPDALAIIKAQYPQFIDAPFEVFEKASKKTNYDIIQMVRDKVSIKVLSTLFKPEDIEWAQEYVDALDAADGWKTPTGEYDVIGMIQSDQISDKDLVRLFGEDVLNYKEAVNDIKPYIKEDGVDIYQAIIDGHAKQLTVIYGEKLVQEFKQELDNQNIRYPADSPAPVAEVKETFWEWLGREWEEWINQPYLVYAFDPEYKAIKARLEANPNDPQALADMRVFKDRWMQNVTAGVSTILLATTPFKGTGGLKLIWKGVGRAGQVITPTAAKVPMTLQQIKNIVRFGFEGPGGLEVPVILGGLAVKVGARIIPKIATTLAQLTLTGVPIVNTGVYATEAFISGDIQRKWDIFSTLPKEEQNSWSKVAGYDVSFGTLNNEEKANVLLHYAVPPGYTRQEWIQTLQEKTDELQITVAEWGGKVREFIKEHKGPGPVGEVIVFAGGAAVGVIEGLSYTAMLPIIAANLTDEAVKGDAKAYALLVLAGMAAFMTQVLPKAVASDPAYGGGRVVGLFFLTPASILKMATGLKIALPPNFLRYIKGRAVELEFTTTKVPISKMPPSPAAMRRLGTELVNQLVSRKKFAEIKIGDWTIRVRNTPWGRIVGDTLWHYTPDRTPFEKAFKAREVLLTKELYASPFAARRFGIMSARGIPATKPGLIGIKLSPKEIPAIRKLLRKSVELEAPFVKKELEPILGPDGKGISFNANFGTFPILFFKLKGSTAEFKGLSPSQRAELSRLTSLETGKDILLGWNGRMQALRRKYSKNRQLDSVEGSIRQLRNEKPEIAAPNKDIINLRRPVQHPTKPGLMRSRITDIPVTESGGLIFSRARASKLPNDVWEAPGGAIHIIERGRRLGVEKLQPKTISETYGRSFESNALQSTKEELGLTGKNADLEYLGMYGGKINEFSLSGSRVYLQRVGKQTPDLYRYTLGGVKRLPKKGAYWRGEKVKYPENEAYIIWDGKTPIKLTASMYDIIKGIAAAHPEFKINLNAIKIYKQKGIWVKRRDKGFAGRIQRNKRLTEKDIDKISKAEIKNLKKERTALLNKLNAPQSFFEFLRIENDLAFIGEMIFGRRRAIQVIRKGKLTGKELELLLEHPELMTAKGMALIQKRASGKVLTKAELKQLEVEVTKAFDNFKKSTEKSYDRAVNEAYRDNRRYYHDRYVENYNRLWKAGYIRPELRRELQQIRAGYQRAYEEDRPRYNLKERRDLRTTGINLFRAFKRVEPEPIRPIPIRPGVKRIPPPRKPPTTKLTITIPTTRAPLVKPPPKVVPPRRAEEEEEKRRRLVVGGEIAWRQGKILQGKILKDVWYVIKFPYKKKTDYRVTLERPKGVQEVSGVGSAYKTIQLLTGQGPDKLFIDLGIMDIIISKPLKKAGRKGSIRFRPDVKQKTKGDLILKGVKVT